MVSRRDFREQIFRKGHDVVGTLAERRRAQADDIQPIVEIVAETSGCDLLREVTVGGGDYAGVNLDGLLAADALESFILQEAQKLGLQCKR